MSVIYSQNWAAGNSTFSTQDLYSTPVTGGTDSDALYPEIVRAENVAVGIGEGPAGENVLKWNGTHNDWQDAGAMVGPGTWDAQSGRVTFPQYFSTEMLAVAFYMPLFWFGAGVTVPDITFGFALDTPGDPSVGHLSIWDRSEAGLIQSAPIDFTPYENTWVTVDICWSLGSPGHGRVKFNGVVLMEATTALNTKGILAGLPSNHHADVFSFGVSGLAGPLTNITVYDTGCTVADVSDVCSCTPVDRATAVAGGGQSNGSNLVQYPTIGNQVACVGSGAVPTQADLTYAEQWWGY